MRSTKALLASPVLLLALLTACGGSSGGSAGAESGGGQISLGGQPANDHGSKNVAGKGEVEMELDDDYFEPTVLTGTPGQQLTLELENEGGDTHTFTLASQDVDQLLKPDGKAKVTVTFPQSGELVWVCRFHQDDGMRGALKVSS